MKEGEFFEAIEDKQSDYWSKRAGGSGIEINWGQWKGKGRHVDSKWEYNPNDECPRCGEYKFRYYAYRSGKAVRSDRYLRGGHCSNCGYNEEVDSDPSKNVTQKKL